MKRTWTVMFAGTLLIGLGGCSKFGDAEAAVSDKLLDPSSAQFREVREAKPGFICGEVNARNTAGGYAGPRSFIYERASETAELEPDMPTEEGRAANINSCVASQSAPASKGCPSIDAETDAMNRHTAFLTRFTASCY